MVQQLTPNTPRQAATSKRRVQLTCPCCGFRIADAPAMTAQTVRLEANAGAAADLYLKCGRCKAEIAARLT